MQCFEHGFRAGVAATRIADDPPVPMFEQFVEALDAAGFDAVVPADLVARRIKCGLAEGQSVRAGERFGIIRFGSRVDVYLPTGYNPLVIAGQRSVGGETVLADARAQEPQRRGDMK